MQPKEEVTLPNEELKKFLLELIDAANYPGKVMDFVIYARNMIREARINVGE